MITAMMDMVAIMVNVFRSADIIPNQEELNIKKLSKGIKRLKNVTESGMP
jgi:hypothetical protein